MRFFSSENEACDIALHAPEAVGWGCGETSITYIVTYNDTFTLAQIVCHISPVIKLLRCREGGKTMQHWCTGIKKNATNNETNLQRSRLHRCTSWQTCEPTASDICSCHLELYFDSDTQKRGRNRKDKHSMSNENANKNEQSASFQGVKEAELVKTKLAYSSCFTGGGRKSEFTNETNKACPWRHWCMMTKRTSALLHTIPRQASASSMVSTLRKANAHLIWSQLIRPITVHV